MGYYYRGKTYSSQETADAQKDRDIAMGRTVTEQPTYVAPSVNPSQPEASPSVAPAETSGRDLYKEAEKIKSLALDPTQLAMLNPKLLMEATYTPEELAAMPDYQMMINTQQAGETLANTPQSSPGALRILEKGLRKKSKLNEMQLGQSEAYKQAGLTGAGISPSVIMSSITERGNEMKGRYNNVVSKLMEAEGYMKNVYEQAASKYAVLKDMYDTEASRFEKIVNNIVQHEQAIDMLERKDQLQREYDEWKMGITGEAGPTIADKLRAYEAGAVIINGEPVDKGSLEDIFSIPGKSKYRAEGEWECAEGVNKITDGSFLGSDWSDKTKYITKRDNPQPGNGLVIPLEGSGENGHAGAVLEFDPETGVVQTVEWNHNGDGKQTFESYTIDQLNEAYSDNWGFTDSTFKDEYQQSLSEVGKLPDWLQGIVERYTQGEMDLREAEKEINDRPESAARRRGWITQFNETIRTESTQERAGFEYQVSPEQVRDLNEIEGLVEDTSEMEGLLEAIEEETGKDFAELSEAVIKTKLKQAIKNGLGVDASDYQIQLVKEALNNL